MKCNHCNSEIEDGLTLCPNCGEVLQEQTPEEEMPAQEAPRTEQKSGGSMKVIAIALCALLLCGLVYFVVTGINGEPTPPATEPSIGETMGMTDETKPAESQIQLSLPELSQRPSYTVAPEVLLENKDAVAVTAGDWQLTSQQLQVFYWMQYIDFVEENGYYAYMLMDASKPFDQQTLPNSSLTWEQYFLDGALRTWQRYATLCDMAQQAGFTLSQELEDNLAQMPQLLADAATEGGYANVEEMITVEMGPGATLDSYIHYTRMYYTAMTYFNALYEQLLPDEATISAYYEEHKAELETQGITADLPPYADVRHILIMPTGGTADASGNKTYSEDEWEACRVKAQGILDTWLAGGATEEGFAQLANEHSEDGGSNTTGGLYTYVTDDGTYVPEFTGWCMDESRQVGDTGLVKTTYGYHIMYLSRIEEAWHLYVSQQLITQLCSDAVETHEATMPLQFQVEGLQVGGVPVPEETTPTE